jgi:hypothetical protein
MDRMLTLTPPYRGLAEIANVLRKVGPKEANQHDDVLVVQALLRLAGTGQDLAAQVGAPEISGRFDAATGFWIFRIQHYYKQQYSAQIVDGVVSPAYGGMYAHGAAWTIVMLNFLANKNNPAGYKQFLMAAQLE